MYSTVKSNNYYFS